MTYCRIYDVKKIDAALMKKLPPDLVVVAEGRTATCGWKNPQLALHVYIQPPKDGIQDFDFTAKKPTGNVLQTLTKVSADTQIVDIDIANYWGKGRPLMGVRVHSTTNSVTFKFPKNIRKGQVAIL